ncbi:unnamed protein product [Natator depressus]|uniref:protein mab-21-like 3 n=1 Tax=Natator depressus TaxID=27790 RepID=UPI003D5ACE48
MAGEGFLQRFYDASVFVRGDDEDFCAWRSYEVVEKTVAKLVEWLYQSSTGLYSEGAQPTGSHRQGLQLQSRASESASDFDFLIPLRFPPELRLRGRRTVRDPSALDRRLPTYIYGAQGVSLFRCGSRLVVDLDTLRADGATAYCDEPAPRTGNPGAGARDRFQGSIDNRHLDPVHILQDFHRYVQNALTADENSHPRDNNPVFQARMIKPRVPQIHKSIKERITLQPWDPKCPAVQLIFRLGEEELVSVDLVPAVQDKVVLSEDWQTNDLARLSDWWDKEPGNSQERFRQKGEEVGRVGADIVAKDGFWRFSFANAETAFLRDIDSDGGQRRKALRLLKFINKESWVPEYGKILTSYHLKTVLLWAQDIHPETEKWETLESSLKTLLSLLRHCVNKRKLPHYFLRDFNLFNKRYREGNGFYECLALQILNKEGELLEVNPADYISLRVPKKHSESPGAFSRAETSLQGFNSSHLKKLKELEEKQLYEWEEEEPGNKNVTA